MLSRQTKQQDEKRNRWLLEEDIIVVRYWNNDVLQNLQGVLTDLVQTIDDRARAMTPSPDPYRMDTFLSLKP